MVLWDGVHGRNENKIEFSIAKINFKMYKYIGYLVEI